MTDDARAPCGQLMEDLSLEARQWQLGKTKLFLRAGVLATLEHMRALGMARAASALQAAARGAMARREAAERRAARIAAEQAAREAEEAAAAAAEQAREAEAVRKSEAGLLG